MKEGYILNPVTGRYIKIGGPTAKKLEATKKIEREGTMYHGGCPEHYVWNPLTGRCNKDSSYVPEENFIGPCPENYTINPKTGRCNKEKAKPSPRHSTGPSGRQLSDYNMFVSRYSRVIKEENPNLKQTEIMKLVAKEWNRMKDTS
jgi:hypothetical protein